MSKENRGIFSSWTFNALFFTTSRIFAGIFLLSRMKRFATMEREAYLHFIIETGLKKHHMLMKLYRNVIFDNVANANILEPCSGQFISCN